MQKVRLHWTDPASGPQALTVAQTPLTIGRDAANGIVLHDPEVSRRHAVIEQDGDQLIIRDLQSRNGIQLNGQRVQRGALQAGARIQIAAYTLEVMVEHTASHLNGGAGISSALNETTVIAARVPNDATVAAPVQPVSDWLPAIFAEQRVPVQALQQLDLSITTVTYATIGAGLGSFVWVDLLRISGVDPRAIAVLGLHPNPYHHYQLLTRNSQIPLHERIRSNSESTPDNVWGWPGYALREIWQEFWRGQIGRAASIFWQIFNEPTFADTYTPLIGNVFSALGREARRIDWDLSFRYGRVRAIRKTDDDRYVIAYSTRGIGAPAGTPEHGFVIANYVHLATGYPTVQFLTDLQRYREETGDFKSVVNAYEDHEHVYQHLRKHGGLVMVRGRGIVASRILQRISEERVNNPNIGIIHLLRSPLAEGHRYGHSQRQVIDHFEFQPFNWPRGSWTGPQRKQLERATPEERKKLLEQWGGTTTARRKDWISLIDKGKREGWYQVAFGEVKRVERGADGALVTVVKTNGQVAGELRYATDFIIDATGLDAKVTANPLLRDLVEHYNLPLNPLERLHVENDFELSGMRNGSARMYAAGAATLGGPNAGVDTFLGLQYAALRSVDSLRNHRALSVKKLNGVRSIVQWLKWARGVKP